MISLIWLCQISTFENYPKLVQVEPDFTASKMVKIASLVLNSPKLISRKMFPTLVVDETVCYSFW